MNKGLCTWILTYSMGSGVVSPGVKRPRRVAPSSAKVKERVQIRLQSQFTHSCCVYGLLYLYFYPRQTINFMRTAFFLGYYAVSSGNLSPTFRDSLSVRYSVVKNPKGSLKSRNTFNGFYRFLEYRFIGG